MLNAFQKKVAASAIACCSMAAIAAFAVLVLVVLAAFLDKFSAVVWPLALSTILAVLFRPLADFLNTRAKLSPSAAALLIFAAAAVLFAGATIYVVPMAVGEISLLVAAIPDGISKAAMFLSEKFPDAKDAILARLPEIKAEVIKAANADSVVKSINGILKTAASATGSVVNFFAAAAAFAVVPIYLYYMLSVKFDIYDFIGRNLRFCGADTRESIVFFARKFGEIMTTFFRGQLFIALIMGTLYGVGLAVVGVRFGFLIGFAAGLLNLIPYFGTIVGLGTIIPVAALQDGGGIWTVCGALLVFVAVQMLEGYVLTPKIMGDRTGLHPTVIIFSVFFWGIALDGILGMILAIPLTAFFVALWRGKNAVSKQLE